jgi:CheY-like chemotaxis protein
MMEQVLMNLCVNARDAMPKGGQLVIGTRRIQIGEETTSINPDARAGDYVCLSVVDTGCGMDGETQKHMFEPFFTTKEVGKGTGLGLANVHGIVRQHNGWVQVASAPDRGTTFEVYLPEYSDAQEFQRSSGTSHPVGGTETILVVEDDQALRRSACLWLRKLGYNVLEAPNGVEALELWGRVRDQVGLLLTDMVMPGGILGAELAERLMAEKGTLKVIVNSGYGPDQSRVGTLAARGVAFLPKPYNPSELANAVRRSFDGERPGTIRAGAQSATN